MGSANKKYTGGFLPQDMIDGGQLLVSLTLKKIREKKVRTLENYPEHFGLRTSSSARTGYSISSLKNCLKLVLV